jgi:hypothetical protein
MFGNDPVTEFILRAPTAPATTTTSGWAQPLAAISVFDFVQSIASLSAGAALIDAGLQINMTGIAEHRVPGRVLSAAAAGQWVAEGTPAPVRALSFSNAAILRPRKLAVISVFTREMVESSNIETITKQSLGEACGLALDAAMFSNFAGDATKPPGLFAGIAPLTGTTGGGSAAMLGDIEALIAALAANGAGASPVFVAAAKQAAAMKTLVGPKFDFPIYTSTALAPGTVAAVEVASFVSGFSSVPEFNVSKVGALHMEDTAPADITGGVPSPAVPVKSLWQTDGLALRTNLWASFGMRASGHAQWISAATW